ncbi:hypothetical protein PSTG_01233 [Puccinia striiformis f. sp. tritici PST-78]|uniref:Uncharacterized protein n=1 Tax=Puccinia striiformis f. sp. tritici PST-78 TaxID=1165861 RepID=A0A0L0W2V2_9BASI|nr:hypothetical protein PSTG_01233 [Puccinia striiformis f. sp. tritici PST-78]
MAFHLADSLKQFGSSRAWWSFSMERLMGHVLKSTGNNWIAIAFLHLSNPTLITSDPSTTPSHFVEIPVL